MPVDSQRYRPTNQQSRPWAGLPAGDSCGKAQLGPASAAWLTGPRDGGPFEPLSPSGPPGCWPWARCTQPPGAALHRERGLVSRWHVRIPVLQGGRQEQLRPSPRDSRPQAHLRHDGGPRQPGHLLSQHRRCVPCPAPDSGWSRGRRTCPGGFPTCWVTSAPPWAECGNIIPTLQIGKLGVSEAPSRGGTGPRKRATCQLGPLSPPPSASARGLGGWRDPLEGGRGCRPWPVTAQGRVREPWDDAVARPLQVSWAAPSRPSDTAPTTSKSSTISEAPSRKVRCPLLPACPATAPLWQLQQALGFTVKMGRGGEACQSAVGTQGRRITHVYMTGMSAG